MSTTGRGYDPCKTHQKKHHTGGGTYLHPKTGPPPQAGISPRDGLFFVAMLKKKKQHKKKPKNLVFIGGGLCCLVDGGGWRDFSPNESVGGGCQGGGEFVAGGGGKQKKKANQPGEMRGGTGKEVSCDCVNRGIM